MSSRWMEDIDSGSTSDPTLAGKIKECYNNIEVDGSNLTLSNARSGVTKTVVVTGGTTGSINAFNNATLASNTITFASTTGVVADKVTVDLASSALANNITNNSTNIATNVSNIATNSTNIDNLEAREQFKKITQHPDVTDTQIGTLTHYTHILTVNDRSYAFEHSSHNHTMATSVLGAFKTTGSWESEDNHVNRAYDSVSGSYYDYSGSNSLGGHSGEWVKVQLPEKIILSSFTMSADSSQSIPRSFKVLGSIDGTNYDLLGEYNDVTVATTVTGTNFKINSTSSFYGNLYDYYAVVVTKALRYGGKLNVAIQHLRYFSVSNDVSETIAQVKDSYDSASYVGNTLTLNRVSGVNPTALTISGGGTVSGDSITFDVTASGTSPNKYVINGISQMELSLLCGNKYIFNRPSGHPLKFSSTADELTPFTTGITENANQTTLIVDNSFPDAIYYYCDSHSGMGAKINILKDSAIDSYVSSSITGQVLTLNKAVGSADTITIPSSALPTTTVNYPSTAMTADTTGSLVASSSTSSTIPSSPAFHAFDKDATTEWLSESNTYSTTDGSYVGYDLKEPQIAMTSNAGAAGYSCSASSVNGASTTGTPYEPFVAFEGNTSPSSNIWGTAVGVYDTTSGIYNGSQSLVTTTGTVSGEYIILNLASPSNLKAIKMSAQYSTSPPLTNAPKDWSAYGKNTGDWELLEQFINSVPGTGFSTFHLTTPTTIAYQSFAILVSKSNGSDNVAISEIEFIGIGQSNLGVLTTSGNADNGEYLKLNLG